MTYLERIAQLNERIEAILDDASDDPHFIGAVRAVPDRELERVIGCSQPADSFKRRCSCLSV